jgi:hypothetical protein
MTEWAVTLRERSHDRLLTSGLLKRHKASFDRAGIVIPLPLRVVHNAP